jgi:hypothetical protein
MSGWTNGTGVAVRPVSGGRAAPPGPGAGAAAARGHRLLIIPARRSFVAARLPDA